MLEYTRKVAFLENGEIAHVTADNVTVYNTKHEIVEKKPFIVEWTLDAATKGGYDHFMLKEIYEQPQGIRDTINTRLDENGYIKLDDIKLTKDDINKFDKIYVVACGTAFHAGCVGKYAIEKLARIPVMCDIASEFRYSDPFVDDKTLVIVVSQSGETADTLRLSERHAARVQEFCPSPTWLVHLSPVKATMYSTHGQARKLRLPPQRHTQHSLLHFI